MIAIATLFSNDADPEETSMLVVSSIFDLKRQTSSDHGDLE